ncbi:hypothetical protein [Chryseobacterium aquifrigidense]|uniref:Uncharacterized protein n=1 Tax=Chryseobacterium aquifrigidense TaxID=558021 RepID=A0A543E9P4_9FLAO|nr:hypothetical protein [Chryseobacterium aquifrigidense]TQM18315.1 hypothetical protein FB551_4096 [Chryseobacterium aquifrigidense]
MKQLQLDLKERLLIVEYETVQEMEIEYSLYKGLLEADKEVLCKGPDLTNEIAKGFIPIDEKGARTKYPKAFLISYKRFLNAFIDVIESKGWYWGENPEGDQPHNTGLVNYYPTGHPLMDVSLEEAKKWLESESQTFNPEKCLIFKLL